MLKHFAILIVLLAGFFLLARGTVVYGPYSYDEADYMFAAGRGIVSNAFDIPTLPLTELIRTGLGRGRDPNQRSELSGLIRGSDDMVFYRHWHGPLYVYWLEAMKPWIADEQVLRGWNYMFPIVTAVVLYFGALWVLTGAAGQIAAVLSSSLFLWAFPVISSSELAPHELFVLCVVVSLLLLAKLAVTMEGDGRKYWYGAIAAAAFAFCTLEIAFVLIATVAICGHAVRDRLKPDAGLALRSAASFLTPVLVVWPAAIFKLSFIKAYLFMGYLSLFRKGAWGSDISVAETWWLRIVQSPVSWILLIGVVTLWIVRRGVAWQPVLLPFAVYTLSMFLAIFRVNTVFPRYALPFVPGMVLLVAFGAALLLARMPRRTQISATAVICVAMFITTYPQVRALPRMPNPKSFSMIEMIRSNGLADKRLLVPQSDIPTIHYYFPGTRPRGYRDGASLKSELQQGAVDAVVYGGDPPRFEPVSR